MYLKPLVLRTSIASLLLLGAAATVSPAQTGPKLSGLAYIDYYYVLDDPAGAGDGDNGFSYRRLYLTGDHPMSENVSFRARLEANDASTNDDGLPTPFVKDLYVRWTNAIGEGHEVLLGVTSPPAFETSEGFFGYRSLEKTQMDLRGIVSSRDFGVRVQGPVASPGRIRYAVMLGNNSSVKRETDRNKRFYAQLEFQPVDRLTVTLGGDYAAMDDGSTVTASGFAGYRTDRFRIGAEAFLSPVRRDAPLEDADRSGVSVFAAAQASPTVELILRYDRYSTGMDGIDETGEFALVGAAFTVENRLRVIPNLVVNRAPGADDPMLTGRITVEANF
jgi:hypothetical protein